MSTGRAVKESQMRDQKEAENLDYKENYHLALRSSPGSLVWCLLRCSPHGFLPHSSPYPAEPDRFASEPGPSGDMMTEEERDRRDRRVKRTGARHSLSHSVRYGRAVSVACGESGEKCSGNRRPRNSHPLNGTLSLLHCQ